MVSGRLPVYFFGGQFKKGTYGAKPLKALAKNKHLHAAFPSVTIFTLRNRTNIAL